MTFNDVQRMLIQANCGGRLVKLLVAKQIDLQNYSLIEELLYSNDLKTLSLANQLILNYENISK